MRINFRKAAENAVENNYIIHAPGTHSQAKDVGETFKEGLKEFYQDNNLIVIDNGKDLENSKEAREELADKIVTQIIKVKQQNPDEPIRLTGHSHGGNVQKLVTQKLVAQGHQNIIDDMMFLASPVRDDYQTNNKALTPEARVLNVSDRSDVVQRLGGKFDIKNKKIGLAKQTIDNNPRVSNIEIEVPNKIGINHIISPAISFTKDALFGDHSDMDSKVALDKIKEKLNEQ